ncbi:hypothetical protein [Streptomyces sp. R08]|uniref:GNAT family N-acetyltransferase n=1 Tax=Streptomyces sp. R08 TaxID=3238624 RepID=A0AB39MQW6_9ACTN
MSAHAEPPPEDSVPHLRQIVDPVPVPLLPARTWTHEEWTRIRRGHEGRTMEDRWNIVVDGQVATVWRSGIVCYEATFEPVDGGWWIGSAVTWADDRDRSPADVYWSDEYDGVMLEWMFSGIVLGTPDADLQRRLHTVIEPPRHMGEGLPGLVLHTTLGLRDAR